MCNWQSSGFRQYQKQRVLGVRISGMPAQSTPAIFKPQSKDWGFFTSVASAKQCWEN